MSLSPSHPRRQAGRVLARYRGRRFQKRDLLGWYLPGMAIVLGCLGYGGWRAYLGYVKYGPAAASTWGRPYFLASAALLTPVLLLFLRHLRLARRQVYFHEKGLRLVNFAPHPFLLLWSEITGVASGSVHYHLFGKPLFSAHHLIIFPSTGPPISLDPRLNANPRLARRIKARIYPLITPELRASLHAGKWLYFGRLKMRRDALHYRNRQLPWKKVKTLRVHAGCLLIEYNPRGKWKIPLPQIANLEILLQLAQQEIV